MPRLGLRHCMHQAPVACARCARNPPWRKRARRICTAARTHTTLFWHPPGLLLPLQTAPSNVKPFSSLSPAPPADKHHTPPPSTPPSLPQPTTTPNPNQGGAAAAAHSAHDVPENAAFRYYYSTNLYRPADVIQDKFLGFEPDAARACADLCASTLGGSCQAWTFCWSSGRCATMARAPASAATRADGRPAYAPQCASGVRRSAAPPAPVEEAAPAPAAPAEPEQPEQPAAGGAANYVTLKFGNDCPMPVVAAVHYKDLAGEWTTGGWFALAPGETKDVARTRNSVFYVRAAAGRRGLAGPCHASCPLFLPSCPWHLACCFRCAAPFNSAPHHRISTASPRHISSHARITPQSYANEKGDPRCLRGCWDGEDAIERFDGRTWGFKEQAVSADTKLGDSYRLAFTCAAAGADGPEAADEAEDAAPAAAAPAGGALVSVVVGAPAAAEEGKAGAAKEEAAKAPAAKEEAKPTAAVEEAKPAAVDAKQPEAKPAAAKEEDKPAVVEAKKPEGKPAAEEAKAPAAEQAKPAKEEATKPEAKAPAAKEEAKKPEAAKEEAKPAAEEAKRPAAEEAKAPAAATDDDAEAPADAPAAGAGADADALEPLEALFPTPLAFGLLAPAPSRAARGSGAAAAPSEAQLAALAARLEADRQAMIEAIIARATRDADADDEVDDDDDDDDDDDKKGADADDDEAAAAAEEEAVAAALRRAAMRSALGLDAAGVDAAEGAGVEVLLLPRGGRFALADDEQQQEESSE